MKRSTYLIGIVVGAIAAVGGSIFFRNASAVQPRITSTESTESVQSPAHSPPFITPALPAQDAPGLSESTPARALGSSAAHVEPSFDQQKAILIADHRAALTYHSREAVDAKWARREVANIEADLAPIAGANGFTVESIDCRTSSCVATLKFPKFGDAQQNWKKVLLARGHTDCGNELVLEDPSDPAGSYGMTVVYDCADARALAATR